MFFHVIESISAPQPYKAINEDAFFIAEDLAVVIDGATGLCSPRLPGIQSDAAWFSHSLVNELKMNWAPGSDFPEVLRFSLTRLKTQWERLTGEKELGPIEYQPLAAMVAVQSKANQLIFYRLADCSAFIQIAEQGCAVFPASTLSADDAQNIDWMAKNRKQEMNLEAARKLSLPAILATRSKTNSSKGTWALSLDAAGVGKMDVFTLDMAKQSISIEVLLTSDGFSALLDDYYPEMGADGFTGICAKGLSAAYNLIRDLEKTDPHGLVFPRFKKHDDATAIRLSCSKTPSKF